MSSQIVASCTYGVIEYTIYTVELTVIQKLHHVKAHFIQTGWESVLLAQDLTHSCEKSHPLAKKSNISALNGMKSK